MEFTMKVKPSKGLKVRDPKTKEFITNNHTISYTGPEGRYWRRRIKCGDVEVITELKEKKTEKRSK